MFGTGSPRGRTDFTGDLAGIGSMQPESRLTLCLDPFSRSGDFQDTNVPFLGGQTYGDPDVCYTGPADTQSLKPAQETGARRIPYALAIRLANHSNPNAVPLATIVEQGSHSTLNSHGSLLSVGQRASLEGVENASPNRIPRGGSRSLDGNALEDIQEDTFLGYFPLPGTGIHEASHGGLQEPGSTCDVAAASRLGSVHLQQDPTPSLHGDCDDNGGMKGFLRGVIQNVRGVSRDQARSCANHSVEQRGQPATGENRPQTCHSQASRQRACRQACHQQASCSASSRLGSTQAQTTFSGTSLSPSLRNQTRSGTMLSADGKSVARADGPLQPVASVGYKRDVTVDYTTVELPRAESAPSPAFFAGPGRHEGVESVGISSRDKVSALLTVDGVSFLSQNAASVEFDKAREEFARLNASFCGTVSTSYSGTVVGVDVDLQHEFAHPVRRSRSATPVWFAPRTAEDHGQAPGSGVDAAGYSVTSPALTSLLPIAAASGIVRSDYKRRVISYYSPSGRQIQRECSTTPDNASYYKQHLPVPCRQVPTAIYASPATPVLVRMKTGRRRVKGCGGIVREDSLIPRSGVEDSDGKDKGCWSAKSAVHNMRDVLGTQIGSAMRMCICGSKDGVGKAE